MLRTAPGVSQHTSTDQGLDAAPRCQWQAKRRRSTSERSSVNGYTREVLELACVQEACDSHASRGDTAHSDSAPRHPRHTRLRIDSMGDVHQRP